VTVITGKAQMPRGPKGEKRPGDVIGAAVMVGRIATGEIEDTQKKTVPNRAKGGKAGGRVRASKLSAKRRREIAAKAAKSRWNLA
jgi:hypothetical protein